MDCMKVAASGLQQDRLPVGLKKYVSKSDERLSLLMAILDVVPGNAPNVLVVFPGP